jgi:hypothetical protein
MKGNKSQQILENIHNREEHNKRKNAENHKIRYNLRVQNEFGR